MRVFGPERETRLGLALRLLLGLVFGVVIWLVGSVVHQSVDSAWALGSGAATAVTYLAIYVPVRWLEWGIVETMLFTGEHSRSLELSTSDRSCRAVRSPGCSWQTGLGSREKGDASL